MDSVNICFNVYKKINKYFLQLFSLFKCFYTHHLYQYFCCLQNFVASAVLCVACGMLHVACSMWHVAGRGRRFFTTSVSYYKVAAQRYKQSTCPRCCCCCCHCCCCCCCCRWLAHLSHFLYLTNWRTNNIPDAKLKRELKKHRKIHT